MALVVPWPHTDLQRSYGYKATYTCIMIDIIENFGREFSLHFPSKDIC